MSVAIREASRADADAIFGLYADAGLDAEPLAPGLRDAAWQRVAAAGALVLVAEAGTQTQTQTEAEADTERRVVGTLHLYLLPQLAHRGGQAAVVDAVAVDPAFQGRGIGRALMLRAMALAREAGCYKLALSSNLRREGAHAFYDALGFERHGLSFVVVLP